MLHFRQRTARFHWQTALSGGSRRGLVIALRIIHQTITCVYGGRFPALGTEQILPLYLSRSQDGVFAEKGGIENAVLHSQGKNALHVGSRLS